MCGKLHSKSSGEENDVQNVAFHVSLCTVQGLALSCEASLTVMKNAADIGPCEPAAGVSPAGARVRYVGLL